MFSKLSIDEFVKQFQGHLRHIHWHLVAGVPYRHQPEVLGRCQVPGHLSVDFESDGLSVPVLVESGPCGHLIKHPSYPGVMALYVQVAVV